MNTVNPIEKVIEMIGDLQQKVIKEGEAAQKTYDEFSEWCEEEARNLQYTIKTAKAEAEDLSATIEKATTDIAGLDAKIGELTTAITTDEADLKAATAIREKEFKIFDAEEKDLMDTVDILERAVGILERELGKGSASFAQVQKAGNLLDALKVLVASNTITTQDGAKLSALLQSEHKDKEDDNDFMVGAPDPATYKSHSGGIIATLNDLLEKAQAQLDEARKVEADSKHNFELLKLELEDSIKFLTSQLDKAKKGKAAAAETKAKAEGDLAVVSKGLAEDMKQLADTHHDCMEKAQEYEIETKSRGEELKALAEAKKIIIEATGGATEQTYGMFLQVDTTSRSRLMTRADLANFEAMKFVKNLAHKLHSQSLMQLAAQMEAAARFGAANGEDPFAKVKGLIRDMIEKLLKEAEEEAAHKGYCDKEMAETKQKKADLEGEIEKLTTKIDEMSAKSAKLKEEVAILTKELAELAATQAEMDKIRDEEHTQFVADKAEMDEGLEGIKLALKVLREYYGKEDHGHAAATGAGGGIIAMLEVIEADFTKGLEEMIAAEEAAAAEYDKVSKENEITKTTKEQDVKYKTKEAKELDTAVAEATADRDGLNTELQAVLDYYEKLKEECIAKPEPYEERKKRREAEIAGLKEALGILSGEAVLLQRGALKHKVLRSKSIQA